MELEWHGRNCAKTMVSSSPSRFTGRELVRLNSTIPFAV